MLLIDPRRGSGELAPLFSMYDIPYAVMPSDDLMPASDFMFCGNGPSGDVMVGIERKKISEIVGDLRGGGKTGKRFSGGQLQKLQERFEFIYLLLEGLWKVGSRGELLVHGWVKKGQKGWVQSQPPAMYSEVSSFLDSLSLRAVSKTGEPLRIVRAGYPEESVAWIVGLYKNYVDKTWGQHHAHDQIYTPITLESRRPGFVREHVTTAQKMWMQVEGVGAISKYIVKKWPMPEDFGRVTLEELAAVVVEVDGKQGKRRQKLGEGRAKKIMPMLRRNGGNG